MAADSWRRCDHRPFGDAARLHHRVALLDWHGRDHFEWRDDRRGQHRRSRNAHHRAHADSCGQPGDGLAGKSEAHADGDRSSVDRCLRTTLRQLQKYLSRGTHRVSEGAVKKEEKPRKFQAIRGTRDLLPPETALWSRVEQTAREVFATFGFGEIRLPIFEPTQLFARAVGGETDIVSKEMYTMPDPETDHIYGLQRSLAEWDLEVGNFENADSFQGLAVSLLVFIVRAQEEKVVGFDFEEVGFEAVSEMTLAVAELRGLISKHSQSGDASTWNLVAEQVQRIKLANDRLTVGEDISLR